MLQATIALPAIFSLVPTARAVLAMCRISSACTRPGKDASMLSGKES